MRTQGYTFGSEEGAHLLRHAELSRSDDWICAVIEDRSYPFDECSRGVTCARSVHMALSV